MKKIWIATCVDHGEGCDGKAKTLGAFASREEAEATARSDIENWADQRAGENVLVDFDGMRAFYADDPDEGCEWNVEGVEANSLPPEGTIKA